MNKYLLDSNIYINFYDRFYKHEYFPSFWEKLPKILNSSVIIPKIVIDENYQDKWFKNWIDNNYSEEIINHKDYVNQWADVLNHISDSPFYKQEALSSDKGWAHERIADPWLIGIAKQDGLTIVTSETNNINLHATTPSKAAKIPDICKDLQIRCIEMNTFFQEVKLKI